MTAPLVSPTDVSSGPETSGPAAHRAHATSLSTAGRVLRALFIAYLVATAIHIGFIVAHEPFSFDAWNIALDTGARPFSLGGLVDYGVLEYTHSNPRIGQWLAYLAYKLTWFAPIATPLAFLAVSLAVTVLGLGRWPSWRRGRDLALWAIALGCLWFALPRIGMIMFCRAYCANYLYGAAIQLWFVVALRLGAARRGARSSRLSLAGYAVLGIAAGMSNEHTGPTLLLFALGYALYLSRRSRPSRSPGARPPSLSSPPSGPSSTRGSRELPRLVWAGALGAVVGFAAIFFAPGQGERYEGLATKVSLLGRLLQRGITSNLDIYRDYVIGCAPVLALIAVALVIDAWRPQLARARDLGESRGPGDARDLHDARDPRDAGGPGDARDPGSARDAGDARTPEGAREVGRATNPSEAAALDEAATRRRAALRLLGLAFIAGTLVTATVFVSPKLGPRFYLHSCALVLAAFIALLDATAARPRRLAPFVVLAVCASIYAGVRTVPLFLRVSEQSDERLVLLTAAPRGAMVTVESFDQVDDSWWFLGDDLRKPNQREMIAGYFGLGGLVFRAVDLDAPLGVTDVRLVPHAAVTPPSCLDDHGGFEITGFRGLDVASIQKAMLDGVARTRARIGTAGRLDRLDLAVELIGAPPELPRKTLLVGRWQPDRFDAWAGAIERRGVGRTRSVILPRELRGTDLEIFVYHLGGPSGGVARRLGTARDVLEYVPWARGGYWALACNPDECFVIAATRVL